MNLKYYNTVALFKSKLGFDLIVLMDIAKLIEFIHNEMTALLPIYTHIDFPWLCIIGDGWGWIITER